jgi:PAS domain-containing protein
MLVPGWLRRVLGVNQPCLFPGDSIDIFSRFDRNSRMITLDRLQSVPDFDPSNRIELFRILLNEISKHLNAEGHSVVPYHPGYPSAKMLSLAPEKRDLIINQFTAYYDVCARALAQKANCDDRTMAWSMLVKMRLVPLSDVFDHIRPGDVIEIYNEDSVQVFRSFSFFKLISYTLEELFVHEWWELYRRPEEASRKAFEVCGNILRGEIDTTVLKCLEIHEVEEVFSQNKTSARVEEVLLSPLPRVGGEIGGFLHVFRAAP